MNNRTYLILVIVLSCALLLVGGAFIGTALYLQGNAPTVVSFPTPPSPANLLLTPEGQSAMPQAGAPAPDITLQTVEGSEIKLSEFRGRPVMLNFWASWCGPCTAEMKSIEAVFQKHTDSKIVILGVNQGEGDSTITGYAELWKLTFPLVRDDGGAASRLYQVRALPTTIFIDAQGNIDEIHIGGPMSQDFIEKRVEELLSK